MIYIYTHKDRSRIDRFRYILHIRYHLHEQILIFGIVSWSYKHRYIYIYIHTMYITYTIYITYIFRLSYTSHTRMHHMHYTSLCLNMNSDFAYNSRVIRLRRGIIPESYKYLGYVRTYIYICTYTYIYIYT